MVNELRRALEHMEHLDPEQQHILAQRILDLIAELEEDERWERTFSSEEGQAILEHLAAEARAEIARGDVEDGGWE